MAIPVVLVGRVGEMARHVTKNLLPEIEVIHFIATPEVARTDLPRMLNNESPSNPSNESVGTQDYSRKPEAILLGLGYYNEIVEDLRHACVDTVRGIPWVRGGLAKAEFDDLITSNVIAPIPQQGPATARKMKKKLQQLLDDGKGSADGLYEWWHEK